MKESEAKQVTLQIENGLIQIYATLQVGEPTKKIRKIFTKLSKKITKEIKSHLKENAKREAKKKKAELVALKKKRKAEEKRRPKPVKRSIS